MMRDDISEIDMVSEANRSMHSRNISGAKKQNNLMNMSQRSDDASSIG